MSTYVAAVAALCMRPQAPNAPQAPPTGAWVGGLGKEKPVNSITRRRWLLVRLWAMDVGAAVGLVAGVTTAMWGLGTIADLLNG